MRAIIAKLATEARGGTISVSDAARALETSTLAASRRLSRLAHAGWLSPVRRGLYAIRPLEAHPDVELAEEDPWVLATHAFDPCYIGGWTAAGHCGLTEQLFRRTMVVTERALRGVRQSVGSADFYVARESRARRSGLVAVWRTNVRIWVSGIERTLVDSCAHPEWVGGGSHLIRIFRAASHDDRLAQGALLREARAATSGAALGRLGLLAERFLPAHSELLAHCRARRRSGRVRFDPAIRENGRLITRWGIWLNIRLRDAEP